MAKPWRPKTISYESGSSRSCDIWNLQFKQEDDKYYVKLLDGLINNISCENAEEWVEIQESGFLVLSVNSSGGGVSSFTLEFSVTQPEAMIPLENLPPTNFKIFFAKIINYAALARFYKPLSVTALVSRSVSVVPTQPAGNKVLNFYTWKIE